MAIDPGRLKNLFLAAIELTDLPARRELLDRGCGGDSELRHRLDSLLAAHDQPASILGTGSDRPLSEPDPTMGSFDRVGQVLGGRYKLME